MKSLAFDEVIKLINHSRVTKITEKPVESEPNGWAIFNGINKVPHFEYDFNILYLYADIKKESLIQAKDAIAGKNASNVQIVYAQSLNKWESDIKHMFRSHVKGIRTTQEYLTQFIKDQMSVYQQKLIEIKPKDFIDPPYETPSGFKHRFPNPLLLMMSAPEDVRHQGELGILIAEPGQGKTFTARYIVSSLCSRNKVPIYIDSQQWATLSPDDLSSIWKTISHSFKYFDSSIDWIEGCEEMFIYVTLKAGIFRLVFDGFDEYILWNRGKIDANDALLALSKLVDETDTPVLITSRTSFWDSDVSQEIVSNLATSSSIYKIVPFDHNHATTYFNKRFGENEVKVKEALKIYDQLRKIGQRDDASNFAGRGFILYLIADLAKDSADSISIAAIEKQTVFQSVMRALCEREQKRQKLPINANTQLEIFREMAETIACGDKVTTDVLRDIVSICVQDINDSGVDDLVSSLKTKGSFKDHPLVRKEVNEWTFVHEQIFYNLLAEQIRMYSNRSANSLHRLFTRLSTGGKLNALIHELATCIVDQLISISERETAIKNISDIVNDLMTCCDQYRESYEAAKLEKILASSIALLAVNRYVPTGKRTDRVEQLMSFMPSRKLNGLHISGSITSMDLSNVVFEECRFDNVIWANCKFSEKTIFSNCHFLGGTIQKCEGFGFAEWKNGAMDDDARALISAERIAAGKKKYSEENLKSDINSVLKKFIPKEGLGFKTVYDEAIESGIISRSMHRNEILRVLVKTLFDKNHIERDKISYQIKESAKSSISHYAINGVYTGELKKIYQELLTSLKL
jgi:hypothetical protein